MVATRLHVGWTVTKAVVVATRLHDGWTVTLGVLVVLLHDGWSVLVLMTTAVKIKLNIHWQHYNVTACSQCKLLVV